MFARYLIFVFLLYNVVNWHQAGLREILLTKTHFWEQTHAKIDASTMTKLNDAATKIKTIRKYTNPVILKLELQVQIVAAQTSHLFSRCADQAIHIKTLMINDGMPIL